MLREGSNSCKEVAVAAIAHLAFNDDIKTALSVEKGLPELIKLLNCENQECERYAALALANLAYKVIYNIVI